MKFFRFTLLSLLLIFFGQVHLPGQDHQDWSYNLSIYDVNVRQYTKTGTFAEFQTHLNRLQDMGAGILWLMPIHPIGVKNRVGSLGSYYAVKDYYGVNPEFGNLNDFKALVDSIHNRGMYVILDWVANHTSWDNSLTVSHPDWYVKDDNGNFTPPPGTNWSDVIQLDYSKEELRTYMIDAMKFWITEANVDGFRCDAVSFMPIDFWEDAITELKNLKPDIFMLAEDDGSEYEGAGFDMSFAWRYLGFGNGILINIADGTNNANVLSSYATQENSNFPPPHYRMYFTSNHDENSWHGTVFEEFNGAAEVFAVLTTIFRSMPLIYSGEEAGLNHRLRFFDKDQIIWRSHSFGEIYKRLLHLKKQNKALWNGDADSQLKRVTTTNNPAIFAFVREKDDSKVFAILNLTNKEQTFTLQGSSYTGNYRNVFGGDSTLFTENAEITLPAWGYKVYEFGSGLTSVNNDESLLKDFNLEQNYPNPFNPETTIGFTISKPGHVSLTVSNLLGENVATILNKELTSGSYQVAFNGNHLSSGIYFYSIKANNFSSTKKMMLLK